MKPIPPSPAAPLDPTVRELLDTRLPARLPPYDAAGLRAGHLASTALLGGEPLPVHAIDGFTVEPSARWATPRLAVRRIVPDAAASGAIVWLHGGGWVTGSLDSFEPFGRALAVASGRQVFLVDYRLAPEAPFPAGLADSVAAFTAIREQADRWGIDAGRMALGGDSAGGLLAIGVTRRLRRAGLAMPAAQLLLYPVADARMQTASYRRYADGFNLSAAQMAWFWRQFVPGGLALDGRAIGLDDPELSPVLAPDLAGLPPTLLVTAECDVLRDEGAELQAALARAGVAVVHHELPGMIHGFIRMGGVLPQAGETIRRMADWLAAALPSRLAE